MKYDTLEKRLARVAEIRQELKHYDALKFEFDGLKYEIMVDMMATKSKRTEAVDGFYAIRVARKDVQVTNRQDLENWIEENYKIEDYKKLDMMMVNPLVKTAFTENGEIVPGTTIQEVESVTIREA